jgi:predicted MFS family arabinose efflux permease
VAFFVVGAPGLLMALVVRFTIREPARGSSERAPVDAGRDELRDVARFLLGKKTFVLAAVAAGLTAFTGYGFGAWTAAFLGRVRGMAPGEIGTWIGLANGIGGAAGSVLGGWLADRLAHRDVRWYLWVPAWSTLIALPLAIPFLLVPDPVVAIAFFFAYAFFGSFFLGPVLAMNYLLVKVRMRALASAILLFILNLIGLGGGPQTVGILNDALAPRFGSEAVLYSLLIVNAMSIVAVLLYFVAGQTLRRDLPGEQMARG